jgi:hypothetical protein
MDVQKGRARGDGRMAVRAAGAALVALGIGSSMGCLDARISGNESSAIGSLRAINSAQAGFAMDCNGLYAPSLTALAYRDYLPPYLTVAHTVERSGYRVTLTVRPGTESPLTNLPPHCKGGATGFVATAVPLEPGRSGRRYFMTDDSHEVKQASDATFADAKQLE